MVEAETIHWSNPFLFDARATHVAFVSKLINTILFRYVVALDFIFRDQ